MIKHLKKLATLMLISVVVVSCQNDSIGGIDESNSLRPDLMKSSNSNNGFNLTKESLQFKSAEEAMNAMNEYLSLAGLNYRISKFEYLTSGDPKKMGQTVFANDRTLRLTSKWVPSDSRRVADGNNITYFLDQRGRVANGSIDSHPSIESSFETWDTGTNCSNLPIIKRDVVPVAEPNTVLFEFFLGAPPFSTNPFIADIVTTGFLPGFIFDVLAPGGSNFILGVCWTLIFVDESGNPSDINKDGNADTALKEVWYNDQFPWNTDGNINDADIETVALHENGHALELGHFGKISRTVKNGKIHFSPRAVMNAAYSGVQRDVNKVTNAAHCSQYGGWPTK